jgi:hypothetical protein
MSDIDTKLGLHDMSGPRIIVDSPDGVVGVNLNDHRLVQLYDANGNAKLGILPHDQIVNAPHINDIHTVIANTDGDGNRKGIPLNTAPETYISTVQKEFEFVPWIPKANGYAAQTDASDREAVVMAIAEHTGTTGSGQSTVISDITGWNEEFVQEILNGLLLSKQTLYRRQYNDHIE